jgi:signal transduction histidine kinase
MLRRKPLEGSAARSVDRIEASAARMRMMIGDLLDFTRGRLGGGIPVETVAADLGAICQPVLEEIATAHPGSKIVFDADGDTSGCWDPARLAQIVQNLVINAIQHGDATRGIRVHVNGQDPDTVSLTVSNHGRPIPPELLPHLFEPFRRLAASEETERASLGLGLFIVSEIARAHGGAVTVHSTEGEGTRFTVTVPRKPRSG